MLTRDPSSKAATALRDACPPGTVELARGDVTEPGTNGDAALAAALVGCTHVVACFGAQRISKIGDILGLGAPETNDVTHPAAVNFRGVARLATAAAKAGTVRRFVRVTGMSVGYHPADPIAGSCGSPRVAVGRRTVAGHRVATPKTGQTPARHRPDTGQTPARRRKDTGRTPGRAVAARLWRRSVFC